MEDFKKNKISQIDNDSLQSNTETDSYIEDINKKLNSKLTSGIISNQLDQFYQKDSNSPLEDKKQLAKERALNATYLWAAVIFSVTNSALMYPISVKLVKKVFRLQGFWNIHFAILPIIINWNALCMGVIQGIYYTWQFRKKYNIPFFFDQKQFQGELKD